MGLQEIILITCSVFLILAVLLWVIQSSMMANEGGWSRLAEHYQHKAKFEGKKWRAKSGRMGLIGYGRCLTIGANNYGLYFAAPFFLRHPPLLIPWDDITTSESKVLFVSYVDFIFARVPSVTIKLPKKFGDMILLVRANLVEIENSVA